jgi:hypothetical protein
MFQCVTFVTNDAPPSDLVAGRTVSTYSLFGSFLSVIGRFLHKRLVSCNNDGILRQDGGISLSFGAVVCIHQPWIFQASFGLFNPLANHRHWTLLKTVNKEK